MNNLDYCSHIRVSTLALYLFDFIFLKVIGNYDEPVNKVIGIMKLRAITGTLPFKVGTLNFVKI